MLSFLKIQRPTYYPVTFRYKEVSNRNGKESQSIDRSEMILKSMTTNVHLQYKMYAKLRRDVDAICLKTGLEGCVNSSSLHNNRLRKRSK